MNMKWRKWKLGLLVSAGTGLLMGVVTVEAVDNISWKALVWILAVNAAKDILLFLKNHPVEQVVDDTTQIVKPQ